MTIGGPGIAVLESSGAFECLPGMNCPIVIGTDVLFCKVEFHEVECVSADEASPHLGRVSIASKS
jgi:hypothetical protein